jgi:hypothetical protein
VASERLPDEQSITNATSYYVAIFLCDWLFCEIKMLLYFDCFEGGKSKK